MRRRSWLPNQGKNVLSDLLKQLLASNFAYYLKAHMFHWNVEGPDFSQLHKFFSKIYQDAYGATDQMAEYIRTLDDYAPGSFERFQELTQISGQTKVPRAQLMLEELKVDTERMIELTMQVFEVAQQERREDIANFMAERQSAHGKYLWQIRSFLKTQRA
jgi:starvation-inducible DNA-binding protein